MWRMLSPCPLPPRVFLLSARTTPLFFPSPLLVLRAFREMMADGSLWGHVEISFFRIVAGWAIGSGLGIPLGLLMGDIRFVRNMMNPYLQFFRFIPPISFVTLSLIWFGWRDLEDRSDRLHHGLHRDRQHHCRGDERQPIHEQAARSLGANRFQVFTRVILPSTIPFLLTGMRLAMGNSFMTIVSAEMIAAERGSGSHLHLEALHADREDLRGDRRPRVLGFAVDALFRLAMTRSARQYLFFFKENRKERHP